jgi:hypothetical protein
VLHSGAGEAAKAVGDVSVADVGEAMAGVGAAGFQIISVNQALKCCSRQHLPRAPAEIIDELYHHLTTQPGWASFERSVAEARRLTGVPVPGVAATPLVGPTCSVMTRPGSPGSCACSDSKQFSWDRAHRLAECLSVLTWLRAAQLPPAELGESDALELEWAGILAQLDALKHLHEQQQQPPQTQSL